MPRISQQKIEKIQEQIIFYLYSMFPKQKFTAEIARELARDEEFVKTLLIELEKKTLIIKIDKNKKGIKYLKRLKWRISNKIYSTYKNYQKKETIF